MYIFINIYWVIYLFDILNLPPPLVKRLGTAMNENAIAEINTYFAEMDQSYYLERINKLNQSCMTCIILLSRFDK